MAERLPVLFVSHGSPMFALNPGSTGPALLAWVQAHAPAEHLRGIVIMSPHWMTRGLSVMTHPHPTTWHDFGGFPPALYELQYPAPGDPALAQRMLDLLSAAGLPAQADPLRPFDHGAWVPLRHMFPNARVPVVQLSLPADVATSDLYAIGQALAPLREEGILLVGSGSMTHNLFELRPEEGPTDPYVTAFCGWVQDTLQRGDLAAMLDYRRTAPQADRAHPTDEHFRTIYFALGAASWGQADGPKPSYISHEVIYTTLSMDAFSLH